MNRKEKRQYDKARRRARLRLQDRFSGDSVDDCLQNELRLGRYVRPQRGALVFEVDPRLAGG